MCRFQSSQANIKISALCFPFVVHRTSCAVHFKLSCRYKVEAKPAARYFALLWGSEMKFYFTNRLLTRSNWRKKKVNLILKRKLSYETFILYQTAAGCIHRGTVACCRAEKTDEASKVMQPCVWRKHWKHSGYCMHLLWKPCWKTCWGTKTTGGDRMYCHLGDQTGCFYMYCHSFKVQKSCM